MSEVAVIDSKEVVAQDTTPAALLQHAVLQGQPIETIEKLMEMQLKWEANEARKAFVKAMSTFHKQAPALPKESKGHNSNYADLPSITSKINPVLAKNGLSFSWVTEQDSQITVHCDVTHTQGHSQRVTLTGGADKTGSKNDIQAIGSTVTYLQRYTLLSALGLATGGDDDGQASSPVAETLKKQQPRRSTSVSQTVMNESNVQVDESAAQDYANRLKCAVFDVDDGAIKELTDELDNDMKLVVWRKLDSEDRTYIKNLLSGE